jgi:hypothetical protein
MGFIFETDFIGCFLLAGNVNKNTDLDIAELNTHVIHSLRYYERASKKGEV